MVTFSLEESYKNKALSITTYRLFVPLVPDLGERGRERFKRPKLAPPSLH